MSTITVEPDLKQALERRAAEAGMPLADRLRRVADRSGRTTKVEPSGQANKTAHTVGRVGQAAATVLAEIPVPPVDPATVRSDDEVIDEFKCELFRDE